MAKVPPEAVLETSSIEITLPENSITLDASKSRDKINATDTTYKGIITKYKFLKNGTVIYDGPNKTVAVNNLTAGTYNFVLVCTDQAGNVSDINSPASRKTLVVKPAPVLVKTIFGASGPTIKDVATLEAVCGLPSVTRTSQFLSSAAGTDDRQLEMYVNADIPCFWNLNWKQVSKDAQGNKIPNPFPTGSELTAYYTALEKSLAHYQSHPKKDLIICVCENEPTTEHFHSGPMSDYINMLKGFVQRCMRYGYKNMTDGGVHVGTVLGADDPDGQGKSADVAQLLQGYASIPELTKINCHTNGDRNFNSASIPQADAKAFSITGRHLWSNEWHATDAEGVTRIMQGWFDAHVPYSVYITGTNDAYILNNGTNLTSFGNAYKQFINAHK